MVEEGQGFFGGVWGRIRSVGREWEGGREGGRGTVGPGGNGDGDGEWEVVRNLKDKAKKRNERKR